MDVQETDFKAAEAEMIPTFSPDVQTSPDLQSHGLYERVPGKSASADGCSNPRFIQSTRALKQTIMDLITHN